MALPLLGMMLAGLGVAGGVNAAGAYGHRMQNPGGAEELEGFGELSPERQAELRLLDDMTAKGQSGALSFGPRAAGIFGDQSGFMDETRIQGQRDAAAMARTQTTVGGAMARQLQAQGFEIEQTLAQEKARSEAFDALLQEYGTEEQKLRATNPFFQQNPELLQQEILQGLFGPPVNPVEQQGIDAYGQGWSAVEPEVRQEILNDEAGLSDLYAVQDYVEQTTAAGRAFSPEATAYYTGVWDQTVIPMLLRGLEGGAPQKAELDLIDKMRGDPFSWRQFTSAEMGRLNGIIAKAEQRRSSQTRAYGLRTPEINLGLRNDPNFEALDQAEIERQVKESAPSYTPNAGSVNRTQTQTQPLNIPSLGGVDPSKQTRRGGGG